MPLEDRLAQAFEEVRLSNTRLINRLRTSGVGLCLALMATLSVQDRGWIPETVAAGVYFTLSLGLLLGSERSPRILYLSRYTVPVVDMPIVFAIQLLNLRLTPAADPSDPLAYAHYISTLGHISEFSVSLFVCLLMLSAFTLKSSQVYLSLGLAILFQQIIQSHAQLALPDRSISLVVFLIAAWICRFAGKSRIQLVEAITRTDARRMRLQRYFSPGVGELLEVGEEDELVQGQECELTILFVDIRGFTDLSSRLRSREVIQLLNQFHAHMVEAIFRHGGTLDKYLGDGLMAYFNAPIGQPDHARRAVLCAREMERELADLNRRRSDEGTAPIAIGIGIHTGKAVVGDIGAPHRREFTAIGQAVNIASRLEGATKELGVTIAVSEATARRVTDGPEWQDLGDRPLRGCPEPIRVMTPRPGNG